MRKRRFTSRELARFNGKGGAPALVAYKGGVYDVSRSFLWKNGRHQALHTAGRDMTGSLDDAPHPADLLRRFPMVGALRED
jgi:predicted heme/steroid binding protein